MKELVEYITKALVDYPDKVVVKEVDSERATIYELRMDPSDVGKVIGKEGRTIKALRAIVACAAAKNSKRVMVEILE